MKYFANLIVKYRIIILLVFILATVLSIIGTNYVKINSDIIAYIPEGMKTSDGYQFLRDNFNMEGDAEIALQDITFEQAQYYASWFASLDGVGKVIWSDTMNEMGGATLGFLTEADRQEMQAKMDQLFHPSEEYYVFMLQLTVVPSSMEAMNLLKNIDKKLAEDGITYAKGGSTHITKTILDSTMGDMGLYTVVAILVIIIILIISTSSYYEPVILFMALGVSVIVNLGTNIFLNNVGQGVSIITFSASSILQLGLSMDYAIFLMHAFKEERQKTENIELAMRRAIPKTFATVSASALTTIGGFVALFVMKFGMGFDLGVVLAKGVFLSLISVLILQPCIVLVTNKIFVRFEHKPFAPKITGVAGFAVRMRFIIVAIALMLLVPSIIGQSNVKFSYMKMEKNPPEVTGVEKVAQAMGNSFVLIVPVENPNNHRQFIAELSKINDDGKTGDVQIFGIYTIMPDRMLNLIPSLQNAEMMSTFINNGYTMYSVMVDVETESEAGLLARERIEAIAEQHFPEGSGRQGLDVSGKPYQPYYMTGMVQGVYDLSVITPIDFRNVSLLSIAIIALILVITLKSFKETLIMLLVIQLGIWINLSIAWVMGVEVNFMAYIIISSIQLGATVDYAILLGVKFKKYCTEMSVQRAAYYATADSAPAILTSASIMAGACLSVYFITSNMMVSEVVMLVARGAALSCILVLVLLPALLILFTRELVGIPKLTFIHMYVDIAEYLNRGTKYNEPFVYPTKVDQEREEKSFKLILKIKNKNKDKGNSNGK